MIEDGCIPTPTIGSPIAIDIVAIVRHLETEKLTYAFLFNLCALNIEQLQLSAGYSVFPLIRSNIYRIISTLKVYHTFIAPRNVFWKSATLFRNGNQAMLDKPAYLKIHHTGVRNIPSIY